MEILVDLQEENIRKRKLRNLCFVVIFLLLPVGKHNVSVFSS